MVAQREAKAEEERLRKKAAADAAFKAVVEQTEKQNNEEDELRMLRYTSTPPFVFFVGASVNSTVSQKGVQV